MILKKLTKAGIAHPPTWLNDNCHYLTLMGSEAYGVSSDESDRDIYGFCMPPKEMVFPHLAGEIPGFGTQLKRFEQYDESHLVDSDSKKEYDFSIYSIVKYFQLCMEGNPNMIDSLFTPTRCVLHQTKVGGLVRDNRHLFLSKKCYHTFKGYSYSQLSKLKAKKNAENPKRKASIEKFGYDVKNGYHLMRLLMECEQILAIGDLDLERDREVLKSIRRGEWSIERIEEQFHTKEKYLETLYQSSSLPHVPREAEIKELLLECLEHHYGDLAGAVKIPTTTEQIISELKQLVNKYA